MRQTLSYILKNSVSKFSGQIKKCSEFKDEPVNYQKNLISGTSALDASYHSNAIGLKRGSRVGDQIVNLSKASRSSFIACFIMQGQVARWIVFTKLNPTRSVVPAGILASSSALLRAVQIGRASKAGEIGRKEPQSK
jgi:hypothetical protein